MGQINSKFGKELKSIIKQKGFTQKQIAEAIGLSQNGLTCICKGYSFPSKNTIEKLCKVLSVEISMSIKLLERNQE